MKANMNYSFNFRHLMFPFSAISRKRSFAFLLCDGVSLSDDNPNEVPISLFAKLEMKQKRLGIHRKYFYFDTQYIR